LRGKAIGNTFNQGDALEDFPDKLDTVKGTVRLYTTLVEHPETTRPTMTVKIDVLPSLAPVLRTLARKYSPVSGECGTFSQ
jgi:hypothetical protein